MTTAPNDTSSQYTNFSNDDAIKNDVSRDSSTAADLGVCANASSSFSILLSGVGLLGKIYWVPCLARRPVGPQVSRR
ncbi:hypothetical protein N7530_005182 [Penicillium desertorum]|uniref:Uncharacterized protein n=1 Tax=Penicillium desertorum TaxID=1303715 RepID=A0A9W9WZK1_9EURO|nr:hypothetical protein N7530_005182 [Penicillium desertorum]